MVEEADQRVHGTIKEVVSERFEREKAVLMALPQQRYDTSYRELRQAAWDGYIDVRGNHYSVPDSLRGQTVEIRLDLEGNLRIYDPKDRLLEKQPVAVHLLRPKQAGWSTVTEHHASLWNETLQVEQRPLTIYEETTQWN